MPSDKSKWKLWEFYEVLWVDIVTDQGWINDEGAKCPVANCRTYGYLTDYKPGKGGWVRLSATIGDNADGSKPEYNQHITIPLGCITEKRIKETPEP